MIHERRPYSPHVSTFIPGRLLVMRWGNIRRSFLASPRPSLQVIARWYCSLFELHRRHLPLPVQCSHFLPEAPAPAHATAANPPPGGRFPILANCIRTTSRFGFPNGLANARKVNLKRCAHSWLTVNVNIAATLLHNSKDRRKPSPVPFACSFLVKKLSNTRLSF